HCHLSHAHSFPTRRSSDLGPQPFLDLIAETVRVAEDTIVVENAAVQVSIQKSIERREPLLILYGERIERDAPFPAGRLKAGLALDRKSTRLNSSHVSISYA